MPSSHLFLCCPLLLLPPIPPSIRVFSSESTLRMRWPKYWSFSFCISLSSEHPGMISFRMDWLDLLAVQGTLKRFLQHHSSKASILQRSAFFIVQLSHPYMITGKTIALTRRTFVGKVMSLLFNILSRFVIAFIPRSKHLLILWLQSHCLQWFRSLRKEKRSAINHLNFCLKKLETEEQIECQGSRKIIKIRAEISEMKNRKSIEKNQPNQKLLLWKD